MFSPNIWSHDPYRQYPKPSFFSLHSYTAPPIPPYTDPYAYQPHKDPQRHAAKHAPEHRRRRPSAFAISASDLSAPSDFDHDTDSTTSHRLHTSHRHPPPDLDIAPHFKRAQVRLPRKTAQDLRGTDEILILPSSLTHLKVSLFVHQSSRKMRVAVAGDMRLRDVVKQLLPQEYLRDARAYVKARGEWVEPGPQTKIGDVKDLGQFVMDDRSEIEVRVIVGGTNGGRERVGRDAHVRAGENMRGRHGWERESGEMERMMVY
jgi:hypothetical protein